MRTRAQWALAGLLAGLGGLATSYLTATWLGLRGNPVTDVAEMVIRLTPGSVAEDLIQLVGRNDKPLLVTGVLIVVLLLFARFGLLSRRWPGAGIAGFVVLGVVGLIANQSQYAAPATGILPSLVGVLTWMGALGRAHRPAPPQPFRDESAMDPGRRFLLAASGVGAGSVVVGLPGVEGRRAPAGGGRRARGADAARRHEPGSAGRRRGGARGHRDVADAEPTASTGSTPRSARPRSRRTTGTCGSTAWSTARSP